MDDVFNALLSGLGAVGMTAGLLSHHKMIGKQEPTEQDYTRIFGFYFAAWAAYLAAGREQVAQILFFLALMALTQMSAARRNGGRS